MISAAKSILVPPTHSVSGEDLPAVILTHQKNRATADFNGAGPEMNMEKLNLRDCIFKVLEKSC